MFLWAILGIVAVIAVYVVYRLSYLLQYQKRQTGDNPHYTFKL